MANFRKIKTVIMAGGKGTRIAEIFPEIPKPLIPFDDPNGISKPVLEWEIQNLKSQGYIDIIITVSYMSNEIISYFGDGSKFGVHIEYFVEEEPLGNAGALYMIKDKLTDPFLLLNADSVFDIDFNRFIDFHISKGGVVTLFTHPNNHPYDSGLIISDIYGSVEKWLTKEDKRPIFYKNRVNAGLHVISPNVLDDFQFSVIDSKHKVDLDRQILKPLCGTGKMFIYDSPEYCKDMGTPDRFVQVSKDFRNGIVRQKNLDNSQRAIFLDRDGTINRYVGFLRNVDDFELLPEVAEAIKLINSSGFLCIVVTNQPVIARGEVTESDLQLIHNKMETLLGNEGAYIDGLYYCPHHPDKGFIGEISELKINCDCRKPKPGLLLRAAKDFNIDLNSSWIIGDGDNDIKAGINAGCHSISVGEESFGADYKANGLFDAVNYILNLK